MAALGNTAMYHLKGFLSASRFLPLPSGFPLEKRRRSGGGFAPASDGVRRRRFPAPARGKAFPPFVLRCVRGPRVSRCFPTRTSQAGAYVRLRASRHKKTARRQKRRKVAPPKQLVSSQAVPPDPSTSALAQVPSLVAGHGPSAWAAAVDGQPAQSRSEQELAALLLAVNYELLGYSPEHAWLLAQRGESAGPGRLDG